MSEIKLITHRTGCRVVIAQMPFNQARSIGPESGASIVAMDVTYAGGLDQLRRASLWGKDSSHCWLPAIYSLLFECSVDKDRAV